MLDTYFNCIVHGSYVLLIEKLVLGNLNIFSTVLDSVPFAVSKVKVLVREALSID